MSKNARRTLWIICVLLIAAQIVTVAFFTAPHPASMRALRYAASVYETGRVQIASPCMSALGLLGRVVHVSPLTLALHVLPFVIIPACYAAYVFLIRSCVADESHAPLILLIVTMLQIFGFQSDAFAPYTLLLGWYTGYALLLHFAAPLMMAALVRAAKKLPERTAEPVLDTSLEEDDDMKHKYLNVRNLGIVFVIFALLSLCAIFVLNRKINNLHAATENLQKSISDKGELIEFRGAVGDTLKGYVTVGSEGGITVVFGGDEEDGEALYQLLTQYGGAVDSWYVKEDERGACTYCMEQGIAVEHIYVIHGMEEEK